MNDYNEFIKEIERLNLEYLKLNDSYEMNQGKKFIKLKELLKKGKIFTVLKKYFNSKKIAQFYIGADRLNDNENYNTIFIDNNQTKKIAVYTCITGDYDNVSDIYLKESNVDYYLFTNNEKIKSDTWNVIKINSDLSNQYNNIELNRFYKINPINIIDNKKYDYAIYVDGNINIISTISDLIDKVNEKYGIAMHKHCERNCIYEEAKSCIPLKKGNPHYIVNQIERYKQEKMPSNFGLLECTVIVTKLNNEKAKEIFEKWWKEFLLNKSYRDQLSLPYILWKMGIQPFELGTLGENVWRNPKFRKNEHK